MATRVLSAILFSPRGGSAHAARALASELRALGPTVTLVAGSRSDLGHDGDARAFYGEVHAVDFSPALRSPDPLRFDGAPGTAPIHPSFEDRPGAPDRVFAMLDDLDYERQVRTWSRELALAGAADADVLHLHHLTPLNEAAQRVAPHVPVVGQLHGTELLMLEQIAAGAPPAWRWADRWAARMRTWARRCARVVVAPSGRERAVALLGLSRDRLVELPGGADLELFTPRALDREAFWRRVLVEQPHGWLPGQPPGSARYGESVVARLSAGTVLLYVGRFTAIKRLDRLIGAFGRAQRSFRGPAGLVLVGGHPGEWEDEHPAELVSRLGVEDVFLAGWQPQERLPEFFSAAEALVLTSAREQFGQVLVEAMACGLPVVATRSLGPSAIVADGRTGWLVDGDDEPALSAALAEVVTDADERRRRGRRGRLAVRERFSWPGIARQLATVLEEAASGSPGRVPATAPGHRGLARKNAITAPSASGFVSPVRLNPSRS